MGDMAKGIKSFKKGMSDDDKKEDKNIENNLIVKSNYAYFWLGWNF